MNPFTNPVEKKKTPLLGGMFTMQVILEGMKHSLQVALHDHDESIRASLSECVQHSLDNYDLAGEVTRQANAVIAEQVRYAVSSAVAEVFRSEQFRKQLGTLVREALINGLDR